MWSLVSNLVIGFIKSFFTTNRDERIGSVVEINKNAERQIDDAKKANELHNRVDAMSDAERVSLADDLNKLD